jgi:hypothetical protein
MVAAATPSVAAAALAVSLDSDTSVNSSGEDAHAAALRNPFASVVVEVLTRTAGSSRTARCSSTAPAGCF